LVIYNQYLLFIAFHNAITQNAFVSAVEILFAVVHTWNVTSSEGRKFKVIVLG